jgi:hypothetical protein
MTLKDLITLILLLPALLLAIAVYILMKKGKLKQVLWPRVLGVGAGLYMFISSMIASILLRPISEIMDYTLTNFFSSFVLGIVAYFSGRIFERRLRDKN